MQILSSSASYGTSAGCLPAIIYYVLLVLTVRPIFAVSMLKGINASSTARRSIPMISLSSAKPRSICCPNGSLKINIQQQVRQRCLNSWIQSERCINQPKSISSVNRILSTTTTEVLLGFVPDLTLIGPHENQLNICQRKFHSTVSIC